MRVEDIIRVILGDVGKDGATSDEIRQIASSCYATPDNSIRGRLSKMRAYGQIAYANGRYGVLESARSAGAELDSEASSTHTFQDGKHAR